MSATYEPLPPDQLLTAVDRLREPGHAARR